jgi:hypothetical protein
MEKTIWEMVAALAAALTALGTTSCMGHGPVDLTALL